MNRTDHQQLLKHLEQGSYMHSCKYVEDNQLSPIQGKHALQFLICSSNSLNKKYSTKHLISFLNYLSFNECIQGDSLTKYISGLYYILIHLIEQEEWKCILQLRNLILPNFISNLTSAHRKYYTCFTQKLFQGIIKYKDKNSDQLLDKTFIDLLDIAIKMEQMCNEKGLLIFLYNIAATFHRQSFNSLLGVLIIDTLIEVEFDLVTKANFKTFMLIMRVCFVKHKPVLSSTDHEDLVSSINKILIYFNKAHIKGVMEYFKSNISIFKTIDHCDNDLSGFATPLEKLHEIIKSSSLSIYLEEIVYFCYLKLNEIMQFQAQVQHKENNEKKIVFTKNLQNNLTMYCSHAKLQGIILKRKELEKKGCGCTITKAISKAIINQVNAFKYVILLISRVANPSEIPSEFYSMLYKLVSKSFELLNLLWDAKCDETSGMWVLLGIPVYNLSIQLFTQKRQSDSEQFLELLTRSMFLYGGQNCLFHNEKTSKSLCYCYINCLVASERWDHAMDLCALSICTYPAHRASIISSWNTIIYNCKSEESICDVIDRKSDFLLSISGQECFNFNDNMMRSEMYMYEIQNYAARFKSISRIEKCFEKLASLISPMEYVSFLITLPFEIVNQLKLTSFITNTSIDLFNLDALHLAIYKYFSYKHNYLRAIVNFKALPKTTGNFKNIEEDETETGESSSIGANYLHVRIDEHDKFFTSIKESLALFNDKNIKKSLMTECVLDLIINIAQEFELQCYEKEARGAWCLAFNIGLQLKAHKQYIYALSFLLKYQPKDADELIALSDEIFSKETIDPFTKCIFFSSLATYYLKTDQLENFHRSYVKAENAFYEFGGSLYRDDYNDFNYDRDFTSGYFALLMDATEFLPCKDASEEMHRHFDVPAHMWHVLLHYIKAKPKNYTNFLALFFTLGEHIIWTYLWCGMFMEAQKYALTLVEVAENALLTHRVCRLLIFLAKIHYHQLRIDDCQVRVDGLLEILHFSYVQPDEKDVADEIKNKLLIRAASPISVKEFRLPAFATHEKCQCTPCTSKEFQNSVIETMHMEALIASLHNDVRTVGTSLNKIFKLYHTFQSKMQFDGSDVHSDLLWTTINYYKRLQNREEMKQNIDLLKVKLEKRQYKNYYLYNHLLNLITALYLEDKIKKTKPGAVCKTPEIKLESERSPTFHTPKSVQIMEIGSGKPTANVDNLLTLPIEFEGRRTRLRSRNLCDRFNDEKQTPQPEKGKQKTTSIAGTPKVSSKRKGLR